VDLHEVTCTCLSMQQHNIPCRHFINAMINCMEEDGDRNKFSVKDYLYSAYLVGHVYSLVMRSPNITV
jgi:SWIM zinc finger